MSHTPAPSRGFEFQPIQLRNGERVRPEEFAPDALEPMHDALDAIQAEEDAAVETAGLESREAAW